MLPVLKKKLKTVKVNLKNKKKYGKTVKNILRKT